MRTRPTRSTAARTRRLVAVGVVALVSASCADAASQDDTTRDDDGQVVEGGEVGSAALKVGDCLEEEAVGEILSVPVVPCSEPHDSELFFSFEIPGDEFPGDAAIQTLVQERCTEEFDDFIGLAYEDSVWDISAVFPTEGAWDQGDREVLCGVFPLSDEDTTGSARGIAE